METATLTSETTRIINKHTLYATGAGLIPVPLVSIAVVTFIQAEMIRKLSEQYQADYDESKAKAWVFAFAGSMAARIGSEVLKFIPGIGSFLGGASMAATAAVSTYALGQVLDTHFKNGGTVQNFNPLEKKQAYEEHKKEAVLVIEEKQHDHDMVMEKVRGLDQMYKDGVITEEEYQSTKARILAAV